MPVHEQPSGCLNDIVLVQSLPCSADIKEEDKEEVVALEAEPSNPLPSPSLSQAVVKVEQRPVLDGAAAAACDEDSDSHQDGEEELPEYIYVDLKEIRKDVQCPICLGIIRKTRTVMECLHRFCRECIDKSMRMGNNECPACRTHCASRRSLRDDPRHDALIAVLFPDIEKYEEEELALCEEDKTRNKQIQESIAQIFQRQSEALGKKRSSCKGLGVPTSSRPHRNNRGAPSRRRKRKGKTELEESDYDEDLEITTRQALSHSDGHFREIDLHRPKTRRRVGSYTSLSPATSSDGGCIHNKLEKKMKYPGIMWNIEMRAWGKAGTRSSTRRGSASVRTRENSQDTRLAKFIEFLQDIEKRDECVASETPSGVEKPSLEANNSTQDSVHTQGSLPISPSANGKSKLSEVVDHRDELQPPEEKKTVVAGSDPDCTSQGGQLILACRQKEAI